MPRNIEFPPQDVRRPHVPPSACSHVFHSANFYQSLRHDVRHRFYPCSRNYVHGVLANVQHDSLILDPTSTAPLICAGQGVVVRWSR